MAMGGRNNYVRLRRWCSTLTRRVVAGGTRRENAGQGIRSRAGEGAIERTGTQKRQSREVLQCCEIRPASGWPSLELAEVWRHLELIYLLIVRDTKVRYKQSLVGIGWALLQPLLTVIVFTVLFDHLVKVPTEGVPYPIFALTALVPWTGSNAIRTGADSNSLEVRARGSELTFFINRQYVNRITDNDNFKGGIAGLYTSGTTEVAFDDLEIRR